MKRSAAMGLQAATVLIGIAVLTFLLWEPHVEGRNADATLFEIYFRDPFLAYAYVASISFFTALYQAFRFWGHAGRDNEHSPQAVKALRIIRYCAFAMIGFVIGGEMIILPNAGEDRPPAVVMGLLVTLGAISMATASVVMERGLRKRMAPV